MSALQAIPTPHGIEILNSELKNTVTKYQLVGALTHDAAAETLYTFHTATIETSYYDENGVLTFILNLPIETHFDEYLHRIDVLDSQNQAVIECPTPKIALAKGIGGMVTLKAAIKGQAGDVVFKHGEYLTEVELNEQFLSPLLNKLKKLPLFPEVINDENRLAISLVDTTLTIEDNQIIRFYGWLEVNTSNYPNKTFQVDLSKAYHIRFNLNDGFYIEDVNSASYNPEGIDESDKHFDTTYDDMNVALLYAGLLMRCVHTNQLSKSVTVVGNGSVLVPVCPRLRNMRITFANLDIGTASLVQHVAIPASVEKGGYGLFYNANPTVAGVSVWQSGNAIALTTNNDKADTTVSVNSISFSRRLQRYQTNQYFTELVNVGSQEWLLRSDRGPCLLAWQQQGLSLNYTNLVSGNIVVEYLR